MGLQASIICVIFKLSQLFIQLAKYAVHEIILNVVIRLPSLSICKFRF
jgi:hypothetical protein